MEMELHPRQWMPSGTAIAPGGGDSRPDWHGLRARLEAARAVRLALESHGAPVPARGSFDAGSACRVEAWDHGLSPVNPSALGNGKTDAHIDDVAVDIPVSGGRG